MKYGPCYHEACGTKVIHRYEDSPSYCPSCEYECEGELVQAQAPQTLEEAILNGLRDSFTYVSQAEKVSVITIHVRDFLAQKFTPVTLKDSSVLLLFDSIMGEES